MVAWKITALSVYIPIDAEESFHRIMMSPNSVGYTLLIGQQTVVEISYRSVLDQVKQFRL